MKIKKTMLISLALSGGMAFSASALAAGASASMLANTCNGCHGPQGNSFGPAIPTIAGNNANYLKEKLLAYQKGDMPSTIMGNIAKGYSEDEIKLMADYFSKQKYRPMAQEVDEKLASAGKSLHKKYCDKCHTEAGTLAEDESGMLSGQWMPYLEYSLADFHSGAANAPKKMDKKLKSLYKDHGDDGIKKLIHYYGSAK